MPGPMNSQDIPLHTEMQCQVCVKENSRYTCPGCGLQFCSVSCSKTHKSVSGCEGKRNKTAFVSKDEFNDTHMFSGKYKNKLSLLSPFCTQVVHYFFFSFSFFWF